MGRVHQGADAEEMEALEARERRGGNEGLEYPLYGQQLD